SKPNPAMRVRTSASFMAAMKSVCSFSMTGRWVPAVARTPFQPKTLKPGRPDSATVGSSGAKAERLAVETARPRMRPACRAPRRPLFSGRGFDVQGAQFASHPAHGAQLVGQEFACPQSKNVPSQPLERDLPFHLR